MPGKATSPAEQGLAIVADTHYDNKTNKYLVLNTVSESRSWLGTNSSMKARGVFSRFVRCCMGQKASLFRLPRPTNINHNSCTVLSVDINRSARVA